MGRMVSAAVGPKAFARNPGEDRLKAPGNVTRADIKAKARYICPPENEGKPTMSPGRPTAPLWKAAHDVSCRMTYHDGESCI